MKASGSLAAMTVAAAGSVDRPMVFVNGAPEPKLEVLNYRSVSPTDARTVTLRCESVSAQTLDRWRRATVTAAIPRQLTGDDLRWQVLASGNVTTLGDLRKPTTEAQRLTLVDAWTAKLTEAVPAVVWLGAEGDLVAQSTGTLALGAAANRSAQQYVVGQDLVYVLKTDGQGWTVSTALATLSAFGGLNLTLTWLPRAVSEAPLVHPLDLTRPMGESLGRLLDDYGLVIQRDVALGAHTVIETRAVRPRAQGRPVALRWARSGQPVSQVLSITSTRPREAARAWIAQGAAWRVESTFELVGGWDPALQGAADAQYSKTASSDFSTYANVYRHWVLNEDGFYSDDPYQRGVAYDLSTLFGQTIAPTRLRFLPALTLDDSGDHLSPMVQVSTDSGTSWSAYTGSTTIETTRAGVYFDDATLPSTFFDAAKAGTARVRITASLQSPAPTTLRRWQGNPFAGMIEPRTLDGQRLFAFRRVGLQSVFHTAVAEGSKQADQVDSTNAMQQWLIEHMLQAQAQSGAGKATLELAGTIVGIGIGDWLRDTGGDGKTIRDQAQAMAQRGASVASVQVRFGSDGGRTEVGLQLSAR